MSEPLLLAHYGGAPEAAMVAVPIALLVAFGLLERRARRREAQLRDAQDPAPEQSTW